MLKEVCVRHREKLLLPDSRGWSALHEAAVQTNQDVLQLVFTGGRGAGGAGVVGLLVKMVKKVE